MELDFNKIIRLKKIRIEKSELSEEESGELFACCAPTLEECRERRDKWLSSRQ